MNPPAEVSALAASAPARAPRLLVLGAAFLGWFASGVQLGVVPLASFSVSQDLLGDAYTKEAGGQWFAWFTAAQMLGAAIGGIALGAFGDRFGRAKGLALSILCATVFGGACAFVGGQTEFLALRTLAGLGIGGVWPNGVSLIAEFWPGVSRPLLAGIFGAAANLGVFTSSQLGAHWEVTPESWRGIFELAAAPAIVGLAALFVVPESPKWLEARGGPARAKTAAPLAELFAPALRSRTLAGIVLAAIPLVGAWAASKWLIPWADAVGGREAPGYKAATQAWWAIGAILGSFGGGHLASRLGRRRSYFLISLASVVATCGLFTLLKPRDPGFLPFVFAQGLISTTFFGWLPLCLPELFPTRVRATGTGLAYNAGRFASAAGVLAASSLVAFFDGDLARVGAVSSLVYGLGMLAIWLAPGLRDDAELED